MPALLLLLALSADPVPLEAQLPDGALTWAVAPHLPRTLAIAKASPANAVLHWVLQRKALDLIHRNPYASGVFAVYGRTPTELAGVGVIEAGAAAVPLTADSMIRALRAYGFVRAEEKNGVTPLRRGDLGVHVFQTPPRVGWASERNQIPAGKSLGAGSLAADQRFKELTKEKPDAHALGRVNVRRVYGMLSRAENASTIAGYLDRLGLMALREIVWELVWPKAETVGIDAVLTMKNEGKGLPAAAGLPHAHIEVAPWPSDLRAAGRVSVRPRALLIMLGQLARYYDGLRYALVEAQLKSLEQRLGKTLDNDILGDRSQLWSGYLFERAAVVGGTIADGASLLALIELVVPLIPQLGPGNGVEKNKYGPATCFSGRGRIPGALCVEGNRLTVARTLGELRDFAQRRAALEPAGFGTAPCKAPCQTALFSAVADGATIRRLAGMRANPREKGQEGPRWGRLWFTSGESGYVLKTRADFASTH